MDIPTSTHSSARDESSRMMLDDSTHNNNTTANATTMAKDGGAAVSARPDLFDANATRKLSVLLVEDDHATLVFVKALLKSCGHTGESGRRTTRRLGGPAFFHFIFFWRGGEFGWWRQRNLCAMWRCVERGGGGVGEGTRISRVSGLLALWCWVEGF